MSNLLDYVSNGFGFLIDHWTAILGVLGFCISVSNWYFTVRNRTVVSQPELLAEMRRHLDFAFRECQKVRGQLGFDRYFLSEGHRPTVNPRPEGLDTVLDRLPELASTVTSVGQNQIDAMRSLLQMVDHNWTTLQSCLEKEKIPDTSLEFAQNLRIHSSLVVKFFPEYIDAIRDMNKKGHVWKRFKYRDHSSLVRKLFRWQDLGPAISEYDRFLRSV